MKIAKRRRTWKYWHRGTVPIYTKTALAEADARAAFIHARIRVEQRVSSPAAPPIGEQMNGCTFGFHKWSLWETTAEGDVIARDSSMNELVRLGVAKEAPPRVKGKYLNQRRKCARCGLTLIRQQVIHL